MGIKSRLKKIFLRREYLPISHLVQENKEFDGKVALISGGSGGIGLAIAKSLQEAGGTVVIAGTNEKKLESLKIETGLDAIVMNYYKTESFDAVIKEVVARHGKLDVFISSAGVHTEKVDFWTMNSDEFNRVMDINLKGVFFACQSVGKYMKSNKIRGSILLVSSSRGSEPAWSPYGISKWGLKGLTEGLAKMFVPYGINVNSIAPGSTATSLIGVKEGDSISSSENELGRLVMPDEVATLASLLVSDAGKMIDGEVVHIAGGRGTFDIR
ncbi:SDR family NAD(P)-dependent oxidoreductase [Lacrimispora celerecrescens]|uniref:SDR family NAD(P)-dependent oxidoreductase n=1 Tax=Lacrimispora celerecrescens TaxID=29354 RepID=UPI0016477584|nr:SDR family oxidoreductase [Lacrimispora celerecrescens]